MQHCLAALDLLALCVLDRDLHRVIAHVLVRWRHRPAPRLAGPHITLHLESIILRLLRENDVIKIDAHRHTGYRVDRRRQCELEWIGCLGGSYGPAGEETN